MIRSLMIAATAAAWTTTAILSTHPSAARAAARPSVYVGVEALRPALLPQAPNWTVMQTANRQPNGISNDVLYSVSGVALNDVWAVGLYCCITNGSQEYNNSLIEHWDGKTWSIVPFPADEPADAELRGIAAVSHNDVWAVGYSVFPNDTLIEHWDGTRWSVVPSPNASSASLLDSIVAISANDIWAVGSGNYGTLTEHWDGTSWSIVPSPTQGHGNLNWLFGVSAVSTNDVWAVGLYDNPNANLLAMHWNGSAWSVIPSGGHFYTGQFAAVQAVSANDVWAVGDERPNLRDSVPHTLIEHWNGSALTVVKSPNREPKGTSPLNNTLSAVTARSANDVWAGGFWTWFTGDGTPRSLFEHWDGKSWRVVAGPPVLESSNNGEPNGINGMATVGNGIWAVGNQQALASQCCARTLVATAK
jgi:hypothetical protein